MTDGPLIRTLLPIAAGAFLLRLSYALAFAPDIEGFGDDLFFHLTALQLVDGHGYVESFDVFSGREPDATAAHPPGYVVALSLVGQLGGRSVDAMRIVGVGAGTVTVVAVGLIAGRLAGRRAAIVAAAICAVYPAFIAADTALMSETLFGALVACAVLLALVLLDRPSVAGMAGLGVLVGLSVLTRSEGLLLVPLLAVPLLAPAPGRRLRLAAPFVVTAALVVAPWVVRNTRAFDRPLLTTNEGTTLMGANCDKTYYGDEVGGFTATCLTPSPPGETPGETNDRRRSEAFTYVRAHRGRAVVVAGARLLRTVGFYDIEEGARLQGRERGLQTAGIVAFYPLLLAGIAGAVALFRRRQRLALAVVLAPIAVSILTAAATYGLIRVRHVAEVSLVALAGVALARVRRRSPQ